MMNFYWVNFELIKCIQILDTNLLGWGVEDEVSIFLLLMLYCLNLAFLFWGEPLWLGEAGLGILFFYSSWFFWDNFYFYYYWFFIWICCLVFLFGFSLIWFDFFYFEVTPSGYMRQVLRNCFFIYWLIFMG